MTLRVALAGDCIVTRGALVTAHPRSVELRDLIRSADFAFANLEVLPNDFRGYPMAHPDGGHLATGSWVIDEMLEAGFSAVGCANNHALDLGVEGLLATIEVLAARGLPFAGIGRTLSEARMPVYVDRPEGSLAVISCSATFRPWQAAAHQGLEVQGRPGLNPLRHTATLLVTAERMEALRAIDRETGLDRLQSEARDRVLGRRVPHPPADDGNAFNFLGQAFRVADEPGKVTACDPQDLNEIARWVQDARQRADLVLVSVHCHQSGPTLETPPDFLREFAHRMVDEGADAVVGHGPHFLRGLEVYEGKPIFYSLGNLVGQIGLVARVPDEGYAALAMASGVEAMTPAAFFSARGPLAQDRRYWETVVPLLTFAGRDLAAVDLYPVTLDYDLPVHRRGRPRLADAEDATAILGGFADLSAALGTEIAVRQEGPIPVGQLRGK